MMVFFVLDDMPLEPLLLLPLREAALVAVEVEVLLWIKVEEMVVPSVVMTVTWVVTWTLWLREVEMLWLVDEASSLLVVCEDDWEEADVEAD